MHLAADLIQSRVETLSPDSATVQSTIEFLDESFSHILWFGGAVGLAASTLLYQIKLPTMQRISNRQAALLIFGGLVYGIGFAIFIIEGRSVSWAIPAFGALVILLILYLLRNLRGWRHLPASIFFLPGFVCVLMIFMVWWSWFNGFPEPSTIYQF